MFVSLIALSIMAHGFGFSVPAPVSAQEFLLWAYCSSFS
jgi:hypothetical protein